APCLMLLVACSTTRSTPPTPELQANLRQPCPPLPKPPTPLTDPERAVWENTMIAMYGDCAARHLRSVEARP
ncbi:hypothetical protein, partial [Novosphingobium clariflavum]